MADKVIDVEIRPNLNGIRSLSAEILKMRNELKTATDPKEVDRLNKALKQTEEQVKDINTATDKFDLSKKFDDVYKDTAPLSSRLGELEDRMYELAFSGKSASEEFAALQKEAVSMRQTIIGVDKQVDILADNKGFSVFGDGLGEVGASLARMDFDTASKQASTLSNNVSKMTFGKAIGSIKSLGSTIISLGKAILSNPLFLLIGVITAIAVGIYKLLDSLGVIKVAFEMLGAVIKVVVDAIKDFLDWIGLTDFAGEESAKKAEANAERRANAEKRAREIVIASMDREIQIRQALGEDTIELERNKLDILIDVARKDVEAQTKRLQALKLIGLDRNEVYDEEMDKLHEMTQEFDQLKTDRVLIDIEETNTQKDNQKERIANAKEYSQNRLNAERELEDLQAERMQEGVEKELHLNRLKYKRLIEDLKTNEDLTKEEREKFQQQYTHSLMSSNIEIVKANQEKNDKIKEDNKKKEEDELKALNAFNDKKDALEISLMTEGDEKKKAKAQFDFEQRIAQLESEGLYTIEIEKKLKQQLVDDLEKIDTDAKDKEKKREEELKDAKVAIAGSVLSSLSSLTDTFAGKSEASQRRAFNINKAIGIAQATMNTSQAVTKALAETTDPTPTQSLRIANAVAIGLAGVAQVASIAKQKFSPSGGGGGGGNVPTPSGAGAGGGGAQAQATPNLELFGQANGLNTFFQAQGQEQQTVQAVISLDQFSTSKDKQAQIFENSTL